MATTVSSSNQDTNINSITGGAVRVTIVANVGQGNGGTSLPCRTCYLTLPSGNDGIVRVNIDIAASNTLGIILLEAVAPFEIPIDDVSKLYFYSDDTADDIIDILYRN